MSFDLATIASRIDALVQSVDSGLEQERFDALRSVWSRIDVHDVTARLSTVGARTSFLVAGGHDDYRQRVPLPPIPTDYTLAATDGSMIVPDRHSPARFYLINIGKVLLEYGEPSRAELTSESDLRFEEHDLFVPDDVRRIPVNETILGLRRAAMELRTASEMIASAHGPAMALLDGTLILWSLQSQDKGIVEWIISEYVDALETFRQQRMPVASYISSPGSSDLMNAARVAICDYPDQGLPINCDACRHRIRTENRMPRCDILPSVPDRYLMDRIASLQPGERTALFESRSTILDRYPAWQQIRFFYVHTGREIGRVEVPAWVADEPDMVDLVHCVVVDQCDRGRGYPVALQEAHEMAVLSMHDRRLIEETIERRLAGMGIVMMRTGKDGSKRGRFV